jgi:Fe-Mn family superoxide dismutase
MTAEKQNLSRREILKAGATLLGSAGLAGISTNKAGIAATKLNLKNKLIQAKNFEPLANKPPQGMSSKQISSHLGLYNKYVSAVNKVQATEKQTGIDHHTLQDKGYAYGGVVLHELYFANLAQAPTQLNYGSPLMKAIEAEYGAYEGLINNFKQAGKASRGWAIFGLNLLNKHLDIYGLDAHHEGSNLTWIWPVLVMDVYEHAYMIDHGTNKAAYINEFVQNINWPIAESRFNQGLNIMQAAELVV